MLIKLNEPTKCDVCQKRKRERGVWVGGARECQGRERWKSKQAAHTLLGEFLEMGPGALCIRAEPGGEELHRGILPPTPPHHRYACTCQARPSLRPRRPYPKSRTASSRQQAAEQAQATSEPQQRARTVVVARSAMVCSPPMDGSLRDRGKLQPG